MNKSKRWLAVGLMVLMVLGATIGELPAVKQACPGMTLDMFSS